MEICLFLGKLYGKGRRMTTEKEENISEKDKMAHTGWGEWILNKQGTELVWTVVQSEPTFSLKQFRYWLSRRVSDKSHNVSRQMWPWPGRIGTIPRPTGLSGGGLSGVILLRGDPADASYGKWEGQGCLGGPGDQVCLFIWFTWFKQSNYRENVRCHACDWHTNTHGKVVQYSIWAESATLSRKNDIPGILIKIRSCICYI